MMRESRYVTVARLAYQVARQVLPLYRHPKSPHRFTQPPLAACVMLAFYLDLSYRDVEEWLLASDQICAVLELKHIPDHSTLARMFRKLTQAHWQHLNQKLLDHMNLTPEEGVALDTTGFRLKHASAYYMTRRGTQYRDWIKGGYAVGIASQLIVGMKSGTGSEGNDIGYLMPLRRQAARYARRRAWWVIADKGFDGKATRSTDLIAVNRRYGIKAQTRKAREERVAQARLEGFYGQRWKVETVNAVIKRLCGDTIRSRDRRLQRREPFAKGIVYNLHR
jgi:hypothetical protein